MIISNQIRAARGLLSWSAEDLAERSGVGIATIRRMERGAGIPQSRTRTLIDIQKALEAAGVEFVGTPQDGPGVRLWQKPPAKKRGG